MNLRVKLRILVKPDYFFIKRRKTEGGVIEHFSKSPFNWQSKRNSWAKQVWHQGHPSPEAFWAFLSLTVSSQKLSKERVLFPKTFNCNTGYKTSRSSETGLLHPKTGRESTEDWPTAAETLSVNTIFFWETRVH